MSAAVLRRELRDRRGALAQVAAERGVASDREVLNVLVESRAGVDRGAAIAGLDGRVDLVALAAERDRLVNGEQTGAATAGGDAGRRNEAAGEDGARRVAHAQPIRRRSPSWLCVRGPDERPLTGRTRGARPASGTGRRGSPPRRRRCRTPYAGRRTSQASRSSSSQPARGSPSRGWPTLPGFIGRSPWARWSYWWLGPRVCPLADSPLGVPPRTTAPRGGGRTDQANPVGLGVRRQFRLQRRQPLLQIGSPGAGVEQADVLVEIGRLELVGTRGSRA